MISSWTTFLGFFKSGLEGRDPPRDPRDARSDRPPHLLATVEQTDDRRSLFHGAVLQQVARLAIIASNSGTATWRLKGSTCGPASPGERSASRQRISRVIPAV